MEKIIELCKHFGLFSLTDGCTPSARDPVPWEPWDIFNRHGSVLWPCSSIVTVVTGSIPTLDDTND